MLSNDHASTVLGMTLLDVGPGRASMRMTVRKDMVNGWGVCHGGLMAALADTTFAVACNSYGEIAVAASFDITFLLPAKVGDVLETPRRSAVLPAAQASTTSPFEKCSMDTKVL